MEFTYRCIDCASFPTCDDSCYSAPSCPSFRKRETGMRLEWLQSVLTKTQYLYWIEYYINNLKLADISIKYDVHITTVCRVLKNARKRIDSAVQKG